METISNITSGVSKLVFGEGSTQNNETGGREPVNGLQGKGTADSPFDQGNVTPAVEKDELEPVSGVKGKGTAEDPFDQGNSESATAAGATKESNTYLPKSSYIGEDNSGTTAVKPISAIPNITSPQETAITATSPEPKITPPSNAIEPTHSNTTAPASGFVGSGIVPTEKNPATAHHGAGTSPESKQQGANAPLAEPNAAEVSAIKESKGKAEDSLTKKDVTEAIAKVHDSTVPENKSSGVAAEGGHFDAAKPGSGQEAKRTWTQRVHRLSNTMSRADMISGLVEEKEDAKASKTSSEEGRSGSGKEKVSLKDKVKEKLHIKKH